MSEPATDEPGCTVCTHHIKPMKLSTCNTCNPSGCCTCTICGLQADKAKLRAEIASMQESYWILMGDESPLPEIAKGAVKGAFITCRME
ncbi:hypothetical protein LCGC14_0322630 [marine sediment metagenome]|uniref:Uncharacterized protein n=1 Tax=marine sediment metagenome TaxID=412755 RepID=A0A0F9TNY9_9ZZZZ